MKTKLLVLLMVFVLSSCSHQLRLKELTKNDKMEAKIANNDALRRNAYFIYDRVNNKVVTLSEPPPDAVVAQTTELANKLSIEGKIDTEQTVKLAESIVELGQRTVAVNILRDALFRLNEMNINNQNKEMDKISADLFDKILTASKEISLADIEKAKAQKAQAEANLVEAEVKKINAFGISELETQAFDMLLKKDLKNASQAFEKAYKTFPTYHNVDEINSLLKNYDAATINDNDWKEIFKTIFQNYSWKLDKEVKEKINKSTK